MFTHMKTRTRTQVLALFTYLRGNVGGTPANGEARLPTAQSSHEPEVDNLHIALRVQHHVARLEVAVNDAVGVEVGEGEDNLGDVQLRALLAKPLSLGLGLVHMRFQVTSCRARVRVVSAGRVA